MADEQHTFSIPYKLVRVCVWAMRADDGSFFVVDEEGCRVSATMSEADKALRLDSWDKWCLKRARRASNPALFERMEGQRDKNLTGWDRKINTWCVSMRKRAFDLARMRTKKRVHDGFRTRTWAEALVRMWHQGHAAWRHNLADRWYRWANTTAKNQNRRVGVGHEAKELPDEGHHRGATSSPAEEAELQMCFEWDRPDP